MVLIVTVPRRSWIFREDIVAFDVEEGILQKSVRIDRMTQVRGSLPLPNLHFSRSFDTPSLAGTR